MANMDDRAEPTTMVRFGGGTDTAVEVLGRPYLEVVAGRERGRVFELAEGSNLAGRAAGTAVTVSDDRASRWHAEFKVETGGAVLVRDAGSTNGTRLNGRDLGAEVLRLADGDRVAIGGCILRLRYRRPGPPAA